MNKISSDLGPPLLKICRMSKLAHWNGEIDSVQMPTRWDWSNRERLPEDSFTYSILGSRNSSAMLIVGL